MTLQKSPYQTCERFMRWIGQWPYQSFPQRLFFASNLIFAVGSQFCLQTLGLLSSWTNWDLVIECASPIVIDILCLVKFFNCLFNARKMKILLTRMQMNWNFKLLDEQVEILRFYTKEGNKLARTYAVIMYGAMSMYMSLPHVPSILALFADSNETVPRGLLYHVQGTIDVDKYYYIILFHSYYSTFFLMTIPVAADSMFIAFVQHTCGMFVAIGHEIESAKKNTNINVNVFVTAEEDPVYQRICSGIAKHKQTLEFAELLASTYTTSLLILTALNVMVMTFSGVEVVINIDKPEEAFRFGMTAVTLSLHFLFLSLPGQKLLDHSFQLHDSIYASNWYVTSLKTRRLLNLMLMRSRIPCQITAGKLYTMSLQNFGAVIQTAMSYFTVLTSVR